MINSGLRNFLIKANFKSGLRGSLINFTTFGRVSLANTFLSEFSRVEETRSFHSTSRFSKGFDEFFEELKPNEVMTTGRAWTAVELRRKSFDDLHRLWYVLYKERNLLLTARQKLKKRMTPVSLADEHRYTNVKRSMAAIKKVLDERKKIDMLLISKAEIEKSFQPPK